MTGFLVKGQPFIGLTFMDWILVLISLALLAWLVPKWWADERRFWKGWRRAAERRACRGRHYQGRL